MPIIQKGHRLLISYLNFKLHLINFVYFLLRHPELLFSSFIAIPKKGGSFEDRTFVISGIGSEIKEANVSVFVLICQQGVRMMSLPLI